MKEYSQWNTYPQVYIEGKLIGGVDVIMEMEELGQMDELLKDSLK